MANLTSSELSASLRALLDAEIKRRRRSHRGIEKEIGLAHGIISNIFRGRTELRLRHVEAIGRLFGLTLEDLLLKALGYSTIPPRVPDVPLDERFANVVADKVAATLSGQHPRPDNCTCTRSSSTIPDTDSRH